MLNSRKRLLYNLLYKYSKLSIHTKLIIYELLINLLFLYGMQKIQTFQKFKYFNHNYQCMDQLFILLICKM